MKSTGYEYGENMTDSIEKKDGKWYKLQERGLWDPLSLASIAQQLAVYISDVNEGLAHSVTLTIEHCYEPNDIVFRGWWLATDEEVEKRERELAEIEALERAQLAKLLAKYPTPNAPVKGNSRPKSKPKG